MTEQAVPTFTFRESKGITRVTSAREESAETKALRTSLAQGVALSDAQKDSNGYGKAIEFQLAKSGKVTASRTVNRKQKDGTVKAVATKGGQDPALVRVVRLLRSEAGNAGRGLSLAVEDTSKTAWTVRFQTRNRKAASA